MCYNYIGEIMSKKKIKNINIQKNAPKEIVEENQIKNFCIILLIMLVLFVAFYFLTILIKKEKISFSPVDTSSEINYDKILLGNILDYEDEYYVLAVTEDYNEYLDRMKNNEGLDFTTLFDKPCYISEMKNSLNSKFVSDKSNLLIDDIKELRVSTTTLFKIKNKKILEVYEGNENIIKYLNDISK